MKRMILLFAAILLMMSMVITAGAEKDASGNYEYSVRDDGSIMITRYIGEGGNVEIPSQLEGRTVTAIGRNAFNDKNKVTGVSIPDTVTFLGSDAFRDCDGLTFVTIPASVTTMEDSVFRYCDKLTTVVCNNAVIGQSAFSLCRNLVSVTLNGVREIKDHAFSYSSLAVLDFPATLTTLGEQAFEGCGIIKLTIPATITNIGPNAFENCGSMTEVTLMPGMQRVMEGMFQGCKNLTQVTLPDSVTSIGANAFKGCAKLASIALPGQLVSIGEYAFQDSGLTEITIPATVRMIAKGAFMDVDNLTSFTFPEGMTTVSAEMFWNSNNLQEVILPDSITDIEEQAFCNCHKLKTLEFPKNLKKIGDAAFHSSGLTSVRLPEGLESIEGTAFYGCSNLMKAYVPDSVMYMGGAVFEGDRNVTVLVHQGSFAETYCYSKKVPYEYPPIVSGVWEYRVRGDGNAELCGYLGSDAVLAIPDKLDGIAVYALAEKAFQGNAALTEVVVPKGVAIIGARAFADCTSLKKVILPESLLSIGEEAFGNCSALMSQNLPDNVTEIPKTAFRGCPYGFALCVKSGTVTAATCDKNRISYESPHPVSGDWEYFVEKGNTGATVWYHGSDADVVVPLFLDGVAVKHVGKQAFYGNKNVVRVTIPEGIVSLDENALTGCSSLVSLKLPASMDSIHFRAWEEVNPSMVVTVPERSYAETFCKRAYISYDYPAITSGDWEYKKSSFTAVQIVGYIGRDRKITIPETLDGYAVKGIGTGAFVGAERLKTIRIPESVESIEEGAFAGCENVNIVVRLYSYAEAYCKASDIPVKYENMFQRMLG